jgi:hypothetical protein
MTSIEAGPVAPEPGALDLQALDELFRLGFVPGLRTLLGAVRRVKAGTWVLYEEGRVHEQAYWRYGDALMPEERHHDRV